jgi:uncharacterized pyridoxamine 5'-phosphate oxidase family protein
MQHDMDTRQIIHCLLREQQLGVLSTAGDDGPYASLVAYAVSDDDRHLYFATPRTTRKFANLSVNAKVAMLVNNSINRPEDFDKAAAVTAVGKAMVLGRDNKRPALEYLLARHPYLEAFFKAPGCEIVAVGVSQYVLVRKFENVTEYAFTDSSV